MTQTVEMDIRGKICPSCLLLTLRAVNEHAAALRTGAAEVVVTTDDRQATSTIPATVERMGFSAEVARLDEGCYRIRIAGGG